MINKKYPIAVEKAEDNSTAYGVIFPDIPGCFSAGDTFDDAIVNAKEALEGFLSICLEDGDPLPEASKIQDHANDADFKEYIWSFVEVDVTPFLGKSKKVNVTLPESIIKRIDEVANSNPLYKTRSGFLAKAALHELGSV